MHDVHSENQSNGMAGGRGRGGAEGRFADLRPESFQRTADRPWAFASTEVLHLSSGRSVDPYELNRKE